MNINLGIISYNQKMGKEFLSQIEKSKSDIDRILFFSKDDIEKNNQTNKDINVEFFPLDEESIISKQLSIAVLIAPCTIKDDLIKKLNSYGTLVVAPANSVTNFDNHPLINYALNKDLLINSDGIILTPVTLTMMLSPIVSLVRNQYGLDRVVANFVYSVDDVCNSSHQIVRNRNSILENQIDKEIRYLLKDPKLAFSVTSVPTNDEMTYAFINVKLQNDFVISDIAMFAKRFDDIIQIEPNINELPNIESIKEKNKGKIFMSRLREDMSLDHGFNILMSSINLPEIELANKVYIVEFLVEEIKKFSN